MNKYNWLERVFHQVALSSQFMREVTFDVESSYMSSVGETDNHVFIAGLARSGTTILLNAIYESDEFSSLSYEDMPFILAPNLWSKLSLNKEEVDLVERAHGDGIKISIESPEAFEEVFWMTFNEHHEDVQEKFKTYLQLINKKYQKERYLGKNNQNIRRLELISNTFPDSKILVPFRNPIQHAYSLLVQHKKFINAATKDNFITNYMKWIGHTEFGPNYIPIHNKNVKYNNDLEINHWIEQWYLTYKNAFQLLINNHNLKFICYEKLCSTKDYWFQIQEIVQIEEPYDFEFKESKKDIPLNIDKELKEKAMSLYFDLNSLNLK